MKAILTSFCFVLSFIAVLAVATPARAFNDPVSGRWVTRDPLDYTISSPYTPRYPRPRQTSSHRFGLASYVAFASSPFGNSDSSGLAAVSAGCWSAEREVQPGEPGNPSNGWGTRVLFDCGHGPLGYVLQRIRVWGSICRYCYSSNPSDGDCEEVRKDIWEFTEPGLVQADTLGLSGPSKRGRQGTLAMTVESYCVDLDFYLSYLRNRPQGVGDCVGRVETGEGNCISYQSQDPIDEALLGAYYTFRSITRSWRNCSDVQCPCEYDDTYWSGVNCNGHGFYGYHTYKKCPGIEEDYLFQRY